MGTVLNIQRFSIHDGPGIRTTVFLKGCPLDCLWCQNPESKSKKPQLSFSPKLCVSCGNCYKVCPNKVHEMRDGARATNWKLCKTCGICTDGCPSGALEMAGIEKSADEVIKEVARDKYFYDISGGGMTISGGEPLMQPEFTLEILKKAKQKGINTTVDTCGYFKITEFLKMLPFTDLILFDLKQMDDKLHKKFTGKSNSIILDNLKKLADLNAPVLIRIPVICGFTDSEENFKAIGAFLKDLKPSISVELLPYNYLTESKYAKFGMRYEPGHLPAPDAKKMQKLRGYL